MVSSAAGTLDFSPPSSRGTRLTTGLRALTLPILALFALVATTAADLTRYDAEAFDHSLETLAAEAQDAGSSTDARSAITAAPTALQLATIRASGEVARVDSPAPQPFSFGKHAVRASAPPRFSLSFTGHEPVFTHDGVLERAGSLSAFGTSLPPPVQI